MALFVMGVLTGKEEKTVVPPFVIRMVDNLPFFYEYPWGKISYTKLMETCNKDYLDVKNKMLKKIEKGVTQKEAKYSAYGYAAALQYWAYEAILQLGNEYAVRRSHGFPRMVNWESKPNTTLGKDEVTRLFAKNLTVYSVLCPRPNEIEFVSYITGVGLRYLLTWRNLCWVRMGNQHRMLCEARPKSLPPHWKNERRQPEYLKTLHHLHRLLHVHRLQFQMGLVLTHLQLQFLMGLVLTHLQLQFLMGLVLTHFQHHRILLFPRQLLFPAPRRLAIQYTLPFWQGWRLWRGGRPLCEEDKQRLWIS
ncbi:uncharacterized protein LOC133035154 [Cannabis sativa]|uniref:uncharacterized protein LOC133035154 n=1 Tax=Cannabis sativa TaxID=3483 RepID=UPI0029C9EC6A|nr:uncharacterized protein LOC133035154 [Cannabis sativa]